MNVRGEYDMSNNLILNRFFTQNIFMDLINDEHNTIFNTCVRRYVNADGCSSNLKLISDIYCYMKKEYRNEYYYKNTLLNKLLLGRHSLHTTTALTEIPVNKSKADFVLINGKAVVYEIKTELDNFERLKAQLDDYYKAFNHVCVVTSENNYYKAENILKNTNVGIYILTKRNSLSIRKEPKEDNSSLNHSVLFKILRKNEFERILLEHFGSLPNVVPVKYYKACFELFSNINIEIAYKYVIKELKKRSNIEIEEYKNVPYELKFMVYFSKFKKKDYNKLNLFLNDYWRD